MRKKANCCIDCGNAIYRGSTRCAACSGTAKVPIVPGNKFGKWTALLMQGRLVYCRCSCGFEKWVEKQHLIEKRSKGCNKCRDKRQTKYPWMKEYPQKIALAVRGAIARCTEPSNANYANWGGRGISVFAEWLKDPALFCEYISKLPGYREVGRGNNRCLLDRIDNDSNYAPGNLRWASYKLSASNRRKRRPHLTRIAAEGLLIALLMSIPSLEKC